MADVLGASPVRYLDDGPITKRQLVVIATAGFGLFIDGITVLSYGAALLGIVAELHLSGAALGLTASSVFFGMIVGTLIAGPLIDRFGRRPVFLADMVLFIISALLFLAVHDVIWLVVLRFFSGVAIGADMPCSIAIMTEFSPRSWRGAMTSLSQSFWLFGSLIGAAIGILAYDLAGPASWRYILAFGAVPAALLLTVRLRNMPESPRWLLSRGDSSGGLRILADYSEAAQDDIEPSSATSSAVQRDVPLSVLFRGRGLFLLAFTSIFWFCVNATGSTMLTYTPIVVKGLLGTPTPSISLSVQIVLNALYVIVGIIFALRLVEQVGRRPVGIWGFWIPACCIVGMAFSLQNPWLLAILFAAGSSIMLGGPANVYFTWGAELFPTAVRGRALGISNAVGKFGSIAGVFLFPLIYARSLFLALLVIAAVLALGGLTAALMAPETKGRSLDELEKWIFE